MENNLKNLDEYLGILGLKLQAKRQKMKLTEKDVQEEVGISEDITKVIELSTTGSIEDLVKLLIAYEMMDNFLDLFPPAKNPADNYWQNNIVDF
jgi:hypothetical protein